MTKFWENELHEVRHALGMGECAAWDKADARAERWKRRARAQKERADRAEAALSRVSASEAVRAMVAVGYTRDEVAAVAAAKFLRGHPMSIYQPTDEQIRAVAAEWFGYVRAENEAWIVEDITALFRTQPMQAILRAAQAHVLIHCADVFESMDDADVSVPGIIDYLRAVAATDYGQCIFGGAA